MIEQLLHHLAKLNVRPKAKLLLAVSGGIDSVVLLDLFSRLDYPVEVVHCNFQLRGSESDGDAAWVESRARHYNVPCHVRRFDTTLYSKERGISVQMAARELRYQWFEVMRTELACDHIVTAHHLNDSLETILINLTRGTGIEGLQGIPPSTGAVIRPLLFATRKHIEAYAHSYSLQWREDSSNSSEYYTRNLIRSKVIPMLETINPSLIDNWLDTQDRLRAGVHLAQAQVELMRQKYARKEEDRWRIWLSLLHEETYAAEILWMMIKSFGFNFDQCKDIVLKEHQSGTFFQSPTHALTVHGEDLLIGGLQEYEPFELSMDGPGTYHHRNETLKLRIEEASSFEMIRDTRIACLDADAISWPLTWRNWRNGDNMRPLGMEHRKKISDMLVDMKVSTLDKKDASVISSSGEIVWLVGLRIAETCKVTTGTTRVLQIQHSFETLELG